MITTYEEKEVEEETDTLHSLTSVQLVIDQQRGHVVPDERDTDINQVPQPPGHDALCIGIQNLDECRLEQLVSVECEIVCEPCSGSGDKSTPEVTKDELEGLDVVPGLVDPCVLLGLLQGGGRVVHSVESVVREPQGHECHDTELNTERPLRRGLAVRWVCSAVEDQEQDNQDDLVEHLSPTLHQECENDVSASMKLVVSLVDGRASSLGLVFHRGRRRHWVFPTDTESIDEQTPTVANDPAVQTCAPHGRQHDQAEEHDERVLYESGFPTDPVAFETDADLTDDDTEDLEIRLCGDPVFVTDGVGGPTLGPDLFEEWCQVADGEEGVSFGEELKREFNTCAVLCKEGAYTETTQNVSRKVRTYRTQGILLEHASNMLQLPRSFLIRLLDRPSPTLSPRQIRPIHTIDVRVFRAKVVP